MLTRLRSSSSSPPASLTSCCEAVVIGLAIEDEIRARSQAGPEHELAWENMMYCFEPSGVGLEASMVGGRDVLHPGMTTSRRACKMCMARAPLRSKWCVLR